MVLSGMSNMEQLKANIETYKEDKPLNDEEMKTLLGIADQMLGRKTLPCTACHYCVSHCPQELDIPTLLNLYNEHCFTEGGFIAPMALSSYPDDKKPGACIGCRSCEAVCRSRSKYQRRWRISPKNLQCKKGTDYEHSTCRKYGRRKRSCNH